MHPMMLELLPWVHQGYCCSQLLVLLMLNARGEENPALGLPYFLQLLGVTLRRGGLEWLIKMLIGFIGGLKRKGMREFGVRESETRAAGSP